MLPIEWGKKQIFNFLLFSCVQMFKYRSSESANMSLARVRKNDEFKKVAQKFK